MLFFVHSFLLRRFHTLLESFELLHFFDVYFSLLNVFQAFFNIFVCSTKISLDFPFFLLSSSRISLDFYASLELSLALLQFFYSQLLFSYLRFTSSSIQFFCCLELLFAHLFQPLFSRSSRNFFVFLCSIVLTFFYEVFCSSVIVFCLIFSSKFCFLSFFNILVSFLILLKCFITLD